MKRNTSYPEPEQLQKFAQEPRVFHQITPEDYTIEDGGEIIKIHCGNTTYVYEFDYATEMASSQRADISGKEAYEDVIDWYIEGGDFIGSSGYEYEGTWILEEIAISNN